MLRPAMPFTHCGCGAKYSRDEWDALPQVAVARGASLLHGCRACARCQAILPTVDDASSEPELPFTD